MKDQAINKYLWVSIDETTDIERRNVTNVIIGTLEVDKTGKIFLFNSEVLEKANHFTIAELLVKYLWPEAYFMTFYFLYLMRHHI